MSIKTKSDWVALDALMAKAHAMLDEGKEFKHLNVCLSFSSLSQDEVESWYKLIEASDSTPLMVAALRSVLDVIWHDYLVSRKLKSEVETDISLDGLDMIVSD